MSQETESFQAEVESGDRHRGLEALRKVLADAIASDPPARDLAALSARLMSVMAELEKLGAGQEVSKADELKARRAAREAAARASAGGSAQRRARRGRAG